jgi:hypothetical protein
MAREQTKNIILPQCVAIIVVSTVRRHEFDLVLFYYTDRQFVAKAGKAGNSSDLLCFPIDPHSIP